MRSLTEETCNPDNFLSVSMGVNNLVIMVCKYYWESPGEAKWANEWEGLEEMVKKVEWKDVIQTRPSPPVHSTGWCLWQRSEFCLIPLTIEVLSSK